MKITQIIFVSLILGTVACSKDFSDKNLNSCDALTLINKDKYNSVSTADVKIEKVEILDQCLEITYSAGGCSGDSWLVSLIDSGEILESLPPQRNLKFSIVNNEPCKALIRKTTAFNISNLQLNEGSVYLNIKNSDHRVLYEY